MRQQEILQGLEGLLSDLSIEVRYEKGDFAGGFYRYKEKKEFILNKNLTLNQQISVLAEELRLNADLDNMYVVPALREVIENASSVE